MERRAETVFFGKVALTISRRHRYNQERLVVTPVTAHDVPPRQEDAVQEPGGVFRARLHLAEHMALGMLLGPP